MPINTYITVRDVLDMARRFHRRLTEFYDRLNRESDCERMHMLLDFVRRHEKYFARNLEKYEEQEREGLLDTWLQYGPEESPLEIPPVSEISDDMSIDDVQEAALRFDDALASFYADAARLVQSEAVRDLFRHLAKQHETDKATIRKNVETVRRDM